MSRCSFTGGQVLSASVVAALAAGVALDAVGELGERLALVLADHVGRGVRVAAEAGVVGGVRGVARLAGRLLPVLAVVDGEDLVVERDVAPAAGRVAAAAVLAERALVLVVLGVARVAVLRRLLVVLQRLGARVAGVALQPRVLAA